LVEIARRRCTSSAHAGGVVAGAVIRSLVILAHRD
jgi:hypothetical protein